MAKILFPDKLTPGGSRGHELWEDAVEPRAPPLRLAKPVLLSCVI